MSMSNIALKMTEFMDFNIKNIFYYIEVKIWTLYHMIYRFYLFYTYFAIGLRCLFLVIDRSQEYI